ncbi:probable calcium-binding protein CML36 [Cynara cardunculus var. scolymus]|uniref:Calcium-binding EF-hand n=1 Tax=Cynara cardunculus var. scolymus TaxID=59895 RepID=A0A103Y6M6_CYNCS|nr:probable calcium-binding protein CML36 [Cynara cardunculus var. scolymus]KVI03479.1 Calcium-binding EF-hand [Cynara cardunculus var. scolymus]
MKFAGKINPKNLFRSKKHGTVSRSESSSFGSSITTTSGSPDSTHHHKSKSKGLATPTSVLLTHSHEISSDDWSDISADVQFELVHAFRIMDTDGDGRITRAELEALLSRIGGAEPLSPEELSLMLNEVDRDGDGSISLEEFCVISSAFGPPSCDEELRGTFEFFDTDRDGLITADELFSVFKSIGGGQCTLEDCRRMISSVDKNGDGFVCFEDFTRMMEQQR